MTKFHDRVEGRTKQIVGEIIGDGRLVSEGKEQVRRAEVRPETDDRGSDSGAAPEEWWPQSGGKSS
jgi:uncharacterized protein YjbJ (UPF0337 family)